MDLLKVSDIHCALKREATAVQFLWSHKESKNRRLRDDGWRKQPKHVAVLNRTHCIRSVWLFLSVNITRER
jgi:hypothetical protein